MPESRAKELVLGEGQEEEARERELQVRTSVAWSGTMTRSRGFREESRSERRGGATSAGDERKARTRESFRLTRCLRASGGRERREGEELAFASSRSPFSERARITFLATRALNSGASIEMGSRNVFETAMKPHETDDNG